MQQTIIDLKTGLQEDHILQQRMWKAQRIGWIIMIVMLLCALNEFVDAGSASQVMVKLLLP